LGAALALLLPHQGPQASAVFGAHALANAVVLAHELRHAGRTRHARDAQAVLRRAIGTWRLPLAFAAAGVLGLAPVAMVPVVAAAIALGAMLAYERAWIHAGQAVPLS
jgi:hypothetical protein